MAKVEKGDRENYGFDDGSYPCKTSAQMMSAIKLRGHSKAHSAAEVLSHVARMAGKAKKEGRISQATYTSVMNAVAEARKADSSKKS
jgi:hypothetical protein